MRKLLLSLFVLSVMLASALQSGAQPVTGMAQTNGLSDRRATPIAIVHARLWISADKVIEDGMVQWVRGRITYAGPTKPLAGDVQSFDAKGKTLYPGFVEMISDLGLPPVPGASGGPGQRPQYERDNITEHYWNEHCRPEMRAAAIYKYDDGAATTLRKMGFAYALTHVRDGVARGTGALVALAPERPNAYSPIVKADAAACYSFQRSRASRQEYPGSLMGSIALLRQMFLDAGAYRTSGGTGNVSLAALNATAGLPQLFDAGQRLNLLRADKVGKEAGKSFILRGQGDEYMRLDAIKKLGAPLVVPVNLPKPYDVADPLEAENLDLTDLMHGERAAYNLATLQKAGLRVALTTDQLKDKNDFWPNLRKAVKAGLPEAEALRALTLTPARLLKAEGDMGTLEAGRWASFVVADKSLFTAEGKVLETWVAGQRYGYAPQDAFGPDLSGLYRFTIGADTSYQLSVTAAGEASLKGAGTDTTKRKLTWAQQDGYITLSGKFLPDTSGTTRLSGLLLPGKGLQGEATLPSGKLTSWRARHTASLPNPADTARFRAEVARFSASPYPFSAYGWTEAPRAETVLYRNATVWTNEGAHLEGADVLVQGGKIASVGKNLAAPKGARIEDATGRHITPGTIDEHSHIAINGGVNECSHSVTAEARVGDVINSEDPNIYRHLAAGVTAVQLLHGSCNSIGGQSALIKLRWGQEPEQMKIAGAVGFIKCALGENVKQANWGDASTVRYPQTRMGVEQVFKEAFARALAYREERRAYAALKDKKGKVEPRRDLQLEAVLEIVEKKRFITCHSYVASEILMLMRVADSLGFRVNTFTHILEGYKVAQQMKKHGAGASTFADWWYYKMEVQDAIPYNAALMHDVGLTVAINSDDAEMGRRLNQEAAKTVRYGGVSEEEAMKMFTLNPAKLLHLDSRMGSIKVGKDADLVVWDKHPFAAGAKPLQTMVDGVVLFDIRQDSAARVRIATEKNRLIRLQADSKDKGTQPPGPGRPPRFYHCEDVDGRDECWGM